MPTMGSGPSDEGSSDEGLTGNPCPAEDAGLKGLAQLMRLLCEETRLRILFTLAQGERDVTGLWAPMGLPQATVSHHLSFLRLAGLVSTRRAGKHIYYRLGPGARLTAPGVLSVECPSFSLKLELRRPPDTDANSQAESEEVEASASQRRD